MNTQTPTKPEHTIDITEIDAIIKQHNNGASSLIPILQAIQQKFRYLPQEALTRIPELTDITSSAISGVSTFYDMFRHQPVGKHMISVCVGTACHVKGAEQVYDAFLRQLNIKNGSDTDTGMVFTVQKVACLGCCTLAPVVQLDDVTYGHVAVNDIDNIINDFLDLQKNGKSKTAPTYEKRATPKAEIRIGLGSCCIASGSGKVWNAIQQEMVKRKIDASLKRVGCVGMCHQTPLLEIIQADQSPALYARIQDTDVKAILDRHFYPPGIKDRVQQSVTRFLDQLLSDASGQSPEQRAIHTKDEPVKSFLGQQRHIATEHCGMIDPVDFDEYQQRGGFEGLKTCLQHLAPDDIIAQLWESGLRGRGGAGFLTARKWSLVRNAKGNKKYILCNGDEGDPGAFMDRMLLESYPYRILEGMIIAAYAVGASEGYIYIRAEYPLAVKRVREALDKCRQHGLIGDKILGTDFSLQLKIFEGAGAFVCGEETALIASVQGKRGMPYIRPPYPSDKGLFGCPTLVNNTETFAQVPWIYRHGASQFANLGTDRSKGTKVFALAGKIRRGGLIEVPMGITIREIVEDIGGGVQDGRKFKAIQVGGPSGGCLPASLSYLKVDYEALTEAGAMMGSGGLLVLDDSDCMVDIARYFLSFTQDQSCGKCTFCRIGTRRMLDILERLCEGKGNADDLEQLHRLANQVKQGSLCGLGRSAPNPILTTLKYFRDEYEAHVNGICPAKKCKALIQYTVTDDCIGCTICAQKCPVGAIRFTPYQKHEINSDICIRCGTCRQVCPENAVSIE